METKYKWKIITILVLSCMIVAGLVYLNISDRKEPTDIAAATPSAVVSVSAEPSSSILPSSTPIPTPEPAATPTPDAPAVDITSDDSITRMVNPNMTVPADYVPSDLRDVNVHTSRTIQLRAEAADALEQMFQAAIDDRIYLKLVDGYRSYSYQTDLYNYYTRMRGEQYSSSIDDLPGASEHQLGLAADLGCWNGACELAYCFTQYGDYDWLKENSWKYGWIERYPDGKQSVTGKMYSPWHYRYVGIEEAANIHNSGLTMEEYYGVSAN